MTVRLIVPQMMSFNQIGKSSILFSSEAPIVALHSIVAVFSGHVDIGLGDGTVTSFYPGDVFLAEDTSGQGHTATPHEWVRAYVNLD